MKVLAVVHYPVFGGPHNRAAQLAAPLEKLGWTTTILIPDEPGNAAVRLRSMGLDVVAGPLSRARSTADIRKHCGYFWRMPREVGNIRRLIRDRGIDLVLIGGLINPHAAFAARLEGVPLVWQVVDTATPALVRIAAMSLLRRLAGAAMFNGQALYDLHCGRRPLGIPHFVYYPPVDTARFAVSPAKRSAARRRLGIPEDAAVIGMVANLNPMKGIEVFVRAAGRIKEAFPEAHFLVVGAEYESHRNYIARVKREADDLGLAPGRFLFAGEQSDTSEFYPAMDLKLITSVPRSEGTTTTAMEAAACGVPVVATDVGGVAEVVEDGVTGRIVPPSDPAAVAAAVAGLLRDEPLRRQMAANARKKAVETFDVSISAATHVRAFEAAMAPSGKAVRPGAGGA